MRLPPPPWCHRFISGAAGPWQDAVVTCFLISPAATVVPLRRWCRGLVTQNTHLVVSLHHSVWLLPPLCPFPCPVSPLCTLWPCKSRTGCPSTPRPFQNSLVLKPRLVLYYLFACVFVCVCVWNVFTDKCIKCIFTVKNYNANSGTTATRSASEILPGAQRAPPQVPLSSQVPFSPPEAIIHLTSGIILFLLSEKNSFTSYFCIPKQCNFSSFNICTWSHLGR